MRIILKPLFDILTGDVTVMGNIIYNYLILLVVGEIVFRIIWNFVGDLYRMGVINGKASGSAIHWFARLIVYMFSAYVIRGGIYLYEFIMAVPYWIWWIFLGVIVGITLAATIIITIRRRKIKAANDVK